MKRKFLNFNVTLHKNISWNFRKHEGNEIIGQNLGFK